ncbi:MAG: hypothetical protein ACLSFZ_00630 [Frisingicoccus sp.]
MLEMQGTIAKLDPKTQDKLMKDVGFCQILQWFLAEGIALERIENFF